MPGARDRRRTALAAAGDAAQEVTTYAELADEVMPLVRRAFDCTWNLSRTEANGRFSLLGAAPVMPTREYHQQWFVRDPINDALLRRRNDPILLASCMPEWPTMARHPVYAEFAPARGVKHLLFADLSGVGYLRPGALTVVLMRGPRQSDFDNEDVIELAQHLPNLRAAARRCQRTLSARLTVPVLETLLEGETTQARLLIDAAGDVVWASAEARRVLAVQLRRNVLPEPLRAASHAICDGAPGQSVSFLLAHGRRFTGKLEPIESRDGRHYVFARIRPGDEDTTERELRVRFELTRAESDVLGLLGRGLSNAEIAAARKVSLNTVRNQVASVLAKLDVRTRVEAALMAAGVRVDES